MLKLIIAAAGTVLAALAIASSVYRAARRHDRKNLHHDRVERRHDRRGAV